MKGRVAGLAVAALLGGCGGPGLDLQQLLSFPPSAGIGAQAVTDAAAEADLETGSLAPGTVPLETAVLVSGTPTGVFAEVARGALGCWFAADGPLKASHVYRAEAEPPAKGGDAAIVIYERDASMRDQRGSRAYRIAFTAEHSSVRVAMTAHKLEAKLALAMAKDVESWAKGVQSCELRAVLPPPASKATRTARTTKSTKPASKGQSVGKGPSRAAGDKTR